MYRRMSKYICVNEDICAYIYKGGHIMRRNEDMSAPSRVWNLKIIAKNHC